MIKECPVIITNDAISVVKYDNIEIQFPSLGKLKSVFVEFKDGKYSIVKNLESAEKTEAKKKKKTIKKKRETVVEDCIEVE